MAGFIGGARPVSMIEAREYRRSLESYNPTTLSYVDVGSAASCWSSPVYVRRGGFIGECCMDVSVQEPWLRAQMDNLEAGASSYAFVGVTRDQYGSGLGGVTVLLFRSSDRSLVSSTTSDAAGNFTVVTPYYPDAHFIVYQKSGSPDVQGASVFTLIGT